MRLFLAFEIEEELRKSIQAMVLPVREKYTGEVRWTKEHQWHMTLLFFGELAERRVQRLKKALMPLEKLRQIKADFKRTVLFPDERKPKVLSLKAEPEEAFEPAVVLAHECARSFPFDRKKFVPHLTLARSRKGSERTLLEASHLIQDRMRVHSCLLKSLVLYQSQRKNGRYEYIPLASYPLKEPDVKTQKLH